MGITRRMLNTTGFVACAGLMGAALYFQHGMGLNPCPLCVFQRLAVIAVGLVALLAAVHNPGRLGARIYGVVALLVAACGAAVAGRHAWLQNLPPDQVPECGPGLEYMLETFPFTEALSMVFKGSGECAEVVWSFLGLSMPAWVLIWVVSLGIGGLLGNWFLPRERPGRG